MDRKFEFNSQTEIDIDLAITEQERLEAVERFFAKTRSMLHKWQDIKVGEHVQTPEVIIPSNVYDIKLCVMGRFKNSVWTDQEQAAILGIVAREDQPIRPYLFLLNRDGNSDNKRNFVALEDINKAIKRAAFIEKILQKQYPH